MIILVAGGLVFRAEAGAGTVTVTSLESPVSLAGGWKVMIGDDANFAAPDTMTRRGTRSPCRGTSCPTYSPGRRAWPGPGEPSGSGRPFRIDRALPKQDMGLMLGRIGNADETYFNGIMIGATGEFPPAAHSMWNHPRYYMVHRDFIRYGADNVIAVRVSYYLFGEVLGTMALTNAKEWKTRKDMGEFLLIDLLLRHRHGAHPAVHIDLLLYQAALVAGIFILLPAASLRPCHGPGVVHLLEPVRVASEPLQDPRHRVGGGERRVSHISPPDL